MTLWPCRDLLAGRPLTNDRRVTGMRALIFAAGEGARLRPLTFRHHKSCFWYQGEPVIEVLLREMVRSEVVEAVTVAVGPLGDQVKEAIARAKLAIPVTIHDVGGLRGQALTLLDIHRKTGLLSESVLLVDGNIVVTALDIRRIVSLHERRRATFTVAVRGGDPIEPACHHAVRLSGETVVEIRPPSQNSEADRADGWLACPSYYALAPSAVPILEAAESGWGLMWMARDMLKAGQAVHSSLHKGAYAHLAIMHDLERYPFDVPVDPSGYSSRSVVPSDAGSIVSIFNRYVGKDMTTVRTTPDCPGKRRRSLVRHAAYPQVVALRDDDVVGFCLGRPFSPRPKAPGIAELSIYVRDDLLGIGLGGMLLRVATREARAKGFHKLVAWITVGNRRSKRLFEAHGFRRIGVFRKYALARGVWVDKYCYEKLLV